MLDIHFRLRRRVIRLPFERKDVVSLADHQCLVGLPGRLAVDQDTTRHRITDSAGTQDFRIFHGLDIPYFGAGSDRPLYVGEKSFNKMFKAETNVQIHPVMKAAPIVRNAPYLY